jgi:hypothetical protein
MDSTNLPFGIIIAAQPEEQSGISEGDTGADEPTKKVWSEAQKRMEAITHETLETAFRIDSLAPFITWLQSFILLGNYDLTLKSDDKDGTIKADMVKWIEQDIHLLEKLRQMFERVRLHGTAHMQKRYTDTGTVKLKTEIQGIRYLQLLKDLKRYQDPFDDTKYYYFQKLNVLKDWKEPDSTDTKEQKVWYVLDEDKPNYNIKKGDDRTVDRNAIIEICNNEARRSSVELCLNSIYTKNLLYMGMPMIVRVVVTPGENLSFEPFVSDPHAGPNKQSRVMTAPLPPPPSLQETDPEAYARQKADYESFMANLQTIASKYSSNRLESGITVLPAWIERDIVQSSQSLNPAMLETMFTLLNKSIAWALGFPISLIDASGQELTTSRTIMDTIAPYLRGLQAQFRNVAVMLLQEQFPDVDFTFAFSDLHPRDAKEIAQVTKTYMESLKIGKDIGYSDNDIRAAARAYNLSENTELELGGMDIMKAEAIQAAIKEGEVFIEA